MTTREFSDQFDTLVASYRRFKNFDDKEELDSLDFNEYEKSVFLTKAQEDLVVDLYTGRNFTGRSFEETEELREYLQVLIKSASLSKPSSSDDKDVFLVPDDLMFIVYETLEISGKLCADENTMDVYPVTFDEFNRVKKNPFRGANTRRALRLGPANGTIEIVCNYDVDGYNVKYIRKPNPIVLTDMPNGLTVGGRGVTTECELPDVLHQKILEKGVELGILSKVGMISQQTKQNKNRDK